MLSENNKPWVVIDTNVYISALNFGGKPAEVLFLMAGDEIKVFISSFILKEIKKILFNKFGWEKNYIRKALEFVSKKSVFVKPQKKFAIIKAKKDDNKILDCAHAAGARFIISGDTKHLLVLREFKGIRILSSAQFLLVIGRKDI